jgi:hypothetical protein
VIASNDEFGNDELRTDVVNGALLAFLERVRLAETV